MDDFKYMIAIFYNSQIQSDIKLFQSAFVLYNLKHYLEFCEPENNDPLSQTC